MDLKDVIDKAVDGVDEANKAFHAGHHEDAESFLEGVNDYMTLYFGEAPPRPEDVAESANGDTLGTGHAEKSAEVPGSPAQPAAVDPAAAARQVGGSLTDEKPIQ